MRNLHLVTKTKVITKEKDFGKKCKDHCQKILETLKIESPALSNVSNDRALNLKMFTSFQYS